MDESGHRTGATGRGFPREAVVAGRPAAIGRSRDEDTFWARPSRAGKQAPLRSGGRDGWICLFQLREIRRTRRDVTVPLEAMFQP